MSNFSIVIIKIISFFVIGILTITNNDKVNNDKVNNEYENSIDKICETQSVRDLQLLYDKHYIKNDLDYDKMSYIKYKIQTCKK